jgi:mannose-6-phosphate isomerase-like protein (cupin superfamily)
VEIRTLEDSPREARGGQISYLMLGSTHDPISKRLTVTWVEARPGSEQRPHRHSHSEQAYVIVRGDGVMTVDGARRIVRAGTLVLIQPGEEHSIQNTGDEPLLYISASSPPLDIPPGRWSMPGMGVES